MPTEIPNLEVGDKSQSWDLVGNSQVGTCLTLSNLGFLLVFFKYPKISRNGSPLFFPVTGVLHDISNSLPKATEMAGGELNAWRV